MMAPLGSAHRVDVFGPCAVPSDLRATVPPAQVVSQLTHRVFGPLQHDRVRVVLDHHGAAGHGAGTLAEVGGATSPVSSSAGTGTVHADRETT
jgi:hypothetical protein